MATTRADSGGSDTGYSIPPLVPPWQQQVMLLLRVECLFGAAQKALQAGDEATAARMTAEALETIREARELAETARNQ